MKQAADELILTKVEDLIRQERTSAWRRFAGADLAASLQQLILTGDLRQTAIRRYRRRLRLAYVTIAAQVAILIGVLLLFRPQREPGHEWRDIAIVLEQVAALRQQLPAVKPLTPEEIRRFELGWILRRAGYSIQPRRLTAVELRQLLAIAPGTGTDIPEVAAPARDASRQPERLRLEERIQNLTREQKLQMIFNKKFKQT